MKLILPPHHKPSEKVANFNDIREDAQGMIDMVNADNFKGFWKEALALSHCQVSNKPHAFFVVHRKVEKLIGHQIICNASIVTKDDPVTFMDACMSYPFRPQVKKKRYAKVTVRADVPHEEFPNGLMTTSFELEGIMAIMFQHEIDHSHGIDVYH